MDLPRIFRGVSGGDVLHLADGAIVVARKGDPSLGVPPEVLLHPYLHRLDQRIGHLHRDIIKGDAAPGTSGVQGLFLVFSLFFFLRAKDSSHDVVRYTPVRRNTGCMSRVLYTSGGGCTEGCRV